MEGQCGGTLEDPESMDDGGRRPDLGTGLFVSWTGTRLESSRFHVAQ